MVSKTVIALLAVADSVSAFPWVATQEGVDTSLFRRQQPGQGAQDPSTCPVNPNHVPAAPVTAQYPYNNAINGKQGNGKGGYQVPANGDTAHYFVAPDYTKDIRGPCPGLNAAANHNFLAHDGVVTFNELVDAQQNVYNVGYDLAVLLAVLGLTTGDGDPVTNKLSIGCDATARTSTNPTLTGNEPGLDGHNKFEADTSLTRNDFFTHNGDNFKFNGTLFGMMQNVCQGNFDRNNLALYRYQRYQQSRAENPNFYFGPLSLLLYGASSFLYELMPSQNNNLNPDLPTITSFFGAVQNSTTGSWSFNGQEKIPANWTARSVPYDLHLVGQEIFSQYGLYPVEFGGNTGNGQFNLISGPGGISNGKFNATSASSTTCLLYQLATERLPSSLNGFVTPTVTGLSFALSKLNPVFQNLGCPIRLT